MIGTVSRPGPIWEMPSAQVARPASVCAWVGGQVAMAFDVNSADAGSARVDVSAPVASVVEAAPRGPIPKSGGEYVCGRGSTNPASGLAITGWTVVLG